MLSRVSGEPDGLIENVPLCLNCLRADRIDSTWMGSATLLSMGLGVACAGPDRRVSFTCTVEAALCLGGG